MQIEVVVNCGAGSVESAEADAERERVAETFATLGHQPRIAVVVGAALEAAVTAAAERGADVVAVAGGDGSLGTAATALEGTDAVLGVLPFGTFNHFARDLDIPLELAEAARVTVEGKTTTVDLAEVNGRTFVNNSSIGVYPVMVDLRDEIRSSRGWGKVRAVPVASFRVLRRFPNRRLRISADGEQWHLRSPFVFIGNNRYEVGPKGVGARTGLADGVLCCFVAMVETRLGFARMALASVTRGASSTPTLETVCSDVVRVEAHGHQLLVAIDGEIATLRSPLRYGIRPGALRVRVPQDAEPPAGPPDAPSAGSGVDADG
ncbi:diacylglycerol/lipid kinase family protein [Iamia sp.]|uniref:diacylglycerol/lipid kinase family protein n=1 Tax=Iamia sp. TaxID=2722710 RepID=UPI002BF564A8|nr:diacylglycerol kinase family protein [Iamia sp.]HXH58090.1 diacylglycerol kinase family protein [Iamia sp.]